MCLAVPGKIIEIHEDKPSRPNSLDSQAPHRHKGPQQNQLNGTVDFDAAPDLRMGRVSFGQVSKEVSLAFVPKAGIGDYVMIHAGMALEVIDEKAANKVFEALKELEDEGLTGDGWA